MSKKLLRQRYATKPGVDTGLLKRVLEHLHQECELLALARGSKLREKEVAVLVYPKRAVVSFSEFKRKLSGEASPSEVERVLGGYRKLLRSLADVQPGGRSLGRTAAQIEEDVVHMFGLEDRGPHLSVKSFVDRGPAASDDRTEALRRHELLRMRRECKKMMEWALGLTGDVFAQVCERYDIQRVKSPPKSAKFSQFTIVSDSVVFDNTDWVPCKEAELRSRPVQPCYLTRVVTLSIQEPRACSVAFEGNTSGFGIVPLLFEIELASRLLVLESTMPEERRPTRTFFREIDIPAGPVGRRYTFVMRSVFFNGVQQAWSDAADNPSVKEWHSKRVTPTTEAADLTVILPLSPRHVRWEFVRRSDSIAQEIVEAPDQRERIFEPAEQELGSKKEGAKAIWILPRVAEQTVFSFRWSWAPD